MKVDVSALQVIERPEVDPEKVICRFAELLEDVPGEVAVWASLDHGRLSFYVFHARDDDEAWDSYIDAQMKLGDAFDDAVLEFRLSNTEERITEMLRGVKPVIRKA